ncbi:hypothetical protein BLA6993_01610 [Burkholderia lata]|nr:hypothetical protein BLA6993_01610 [Burkholderia lata]
MRVREAEQVAGRIERAEPETGPVRIAQARLRRHEDALVHSDFVERLIVLPLAPRHGVVGRIAWPDCD